MAWEDGPPSIRCGDDDGDYGAGEEPGVGGDDVFYRCPCVFVVVFGSSANDLEAFPTHGRGGVD